MRGGGGVLMAEYLVRDSSLSAVADAIRAKCGTTDPLVWPDGFKAAVEAISSGIGGLTYDAGEFVFDDDIASNSNYLYANPIRHNLGDTPDFIFVWTDHWAGISDPPYADNATMVGFFWLNGLTGMAQRATAAVNAVNPMIVILSIMKSDYRCSIASPTSQSYGITEERLPTKTTFCLANFGTAVWRAGVTYKYFMSKAWWNVGGVANA